MFGETEKFYTGIYLILTSRVVPAAWKCRLDNVTVSENEDISRTT
jgi:hypothetical protein